MSTYKWNKNEEGDYVLEGHPFRVGRYNSKWASWHDDHGLTWNDLRFPGAGGKVRPGRTETRSGLEKPEDEDYGVERPTLKAAKAHVEKTLDLQRELGLLTPQDVRFEEYGEPIDGCKSYKVVVRETGERIGSVNSARSASYASDTTSSPYSYGYRGSPKYWNASARRFPGEKYERRFGGYHHRTRKSAVADVLDRWNRRTREAVR